jgi:hypothetical protein
MADVLYTINYDEKQGLSTSQSIVNIGTSRDRVRFVTTTKNPEYPIALQRDKKKNPRNWPLKGVPDPYPVPLDTAKPKWFVVEGSGKTKSFHYICGYLEDGHFEPYPPPVNPKAGTDPNSLPWPT